MKNTFTTSSIARHFSVSRSRLSQDLNSGFLIDCVPPVKAGQKRVWDSHAYIAAYFYFELCDKGVSRLEASKIATAIAFFSKDNPDEKLCAVFKLENSSEILVDTCDKVPRPNEWGNGIQWVCIYNISAALSFKGTSVRIS